MNGLILSNAMHYNLYSTGKNYNMSTQAEVGTEIMFRTQPREYCQASLALRSGRFCASV